LIAPRRAFVRRLRARTARRHGRDALPATISRRRIYILPTRFGLMLSALIVAMLIAGLNYNSNLALAFAFLMVGIAIVAMHRCNRNLAGITLDARADADTFAGQRAHLEFFVDNASRTARYDIQVLCGTQAQVFFTLAAGLSRRVAVPVQAPARGVLRFDQIELRTNHPFGWFRAWTYLQIPLLVYIAPAPGGERALPSDRAAYQGEPQRFEAQGEEDFAGLIPYRPGDPLKHMAWKTLARRGEPMVRSYVDPRAANEWLEWSALTGLNPEERLSQLCRWVLESGTAQRRYGLRLPGTTIDPDTGEAHGRACLRALALFDSSQPA
jgi:uncharacterized protein (DUF58 family)